MIEIKNECNQKCPVACIGHQYSMIWQLLSRNKSEPSDFITFITLKMLFDSKDVIVLYESKPQMTAFALFYEIAGLFTMWFEISMIHIVWGERRLRKLANCILDCVSI